MISSTTPILPLVTGEHHSGINESRAKSISVDVEMDMDMDNHMELKPPLSITETGKSGTEAAVSAVVEAQDSKDSKDDDNLPDTNNGNHSKFSIINQKILCALNRLAISSKIIKCFQLPLFLMSMRKPPYVRDLSK